MLPAAEGAGDGGVGVAALEGGSGISSGWLAGGCVLVGCTAGVGGGVAGSPAAGSDGAASCRLPPSGWALSAAIGGIVSSGCSLRARITSSRASSTSMV